MQRVQPNRAQIKSFLDGAVIDPNKRDDFITQQLVEQGTPEYFETRVIEYMAEVASIRRRMKSASGQGLKTLKELYTLKMRQAATALAISVGKVNGPVLKPKPKSKVDNGTEGHQIKDSS